VGSNIGQKTVTFTVPFKTVLSSYVSCICNMNSGGGMDGGYVLATTTNVIVTADYANSGGNKSNMYSWMVIGN